jgi:hypothetical protein
VTMVPATLSAREDREGDWVCLECEELDGVHTSIALPADAD